MTSVAPADLADLASTIGVLKGPDRDVDLVLHAQLVLGWDYAVAAGDGYAWRQQLKQRAPESVHYTFVGERVPMSDVPTYTGTMDAALALADQTFPGVWWHAAKGRLTDAEPLFGFALLFGPDETIGTGEGETSCIAIILAIIDGLRSRGRS